MTPGTRGDHDSGEGVVTWWLARGEVQLPPGGEWLTAAERSRAEGLRYAKRRTDFLLGRWTLKLAVARALGWPDDLAELARIEGRTAPSGAPRLYVDGEPAARGVSLSDRAGCAVCLVAARTAAVGCDVEIVEPRSDAFVRDYLTEAERRLVQAAGPARDKVANLVWSAKESALKVLGTGLRRDTRSVEVTVGGPEPARTHLVPAAGQDRGGRPLPRLVAQERRVPADGVLAGRRSASCRARAASPLDTTPPSHSWIDRPVS